MTDSRYTAVQIEERLDDLLGAVLSSRRTATEPAEALSRLERSVQDFALHWAGVISKSNSEMAYQFVLHVPEAFELMDNDGVTQWIIYAMDTYDRQGLYPGSAAFRDIKRFAGQLSASQSAVSLEAVLGILNLYVRGVSGRKLEIQFDEHPWTDTESIYLPATVSQFDEQDENFQLLKSMSAYLWAQNRFGTFLIDRESGYPYVCDALRKFRDPLRAQEIFEAVEEARLLARMNTELPGLVRKMRELKVRATPHMVSDRWANLLTRVTRPDADVNDSLAVTAALYARGEDAPQASCFRSRVDLEQVRLVSSNRVGQEKRLFQTELAMLSENEGVDTKNEDSHQSGTVKVELSTGSEQQEGDQEMLALEIDGRPVEPSEDLIKLTQSIVQDFGEIPEEYLVAAGPGQHSEERAHEDDGQLTQVDDGIFYDEWDYRRRHYRKDWCVLREKLMHPGDERVVQDILDKYRHLIGGIRKTFEILRGDDKLLRRQKNGDDIDIDAVVESFPDYRRGMEMSDRLFIQSRRLERNLAVIFMVDVSGSTKGWINDAERESLVLLCEALETLRDRYAIYGFSGMTRKRCELYRIKSFSDAYDDRVKARIAGIRSQDYTRMGVTIRHLTGLLLEQEVKTRVLVTLSDGKPDDYDGYRGEYGIEDTRQALMEAKYAGIHPFCITIDTHAHDYLPHMYGHVNYTVVDDVRSLPLKVSEIYRKLTT